ncbi:MAG: YhcH/YjgK/YiaL family protein [Prevotellaceae bacterium]|nr:YhcH/YjgK/YiaL family protein [Candidatus Minthosoma equi]
MIIDTIENFGKYAVLNPLFSKVEEFLKNNDLASHEQGKVMIEGKDLFANFTIAKGKAKEVAKIESHDVMIDIQIPISCPETMGYTPRENLAECEYNAEKDITFYPGLAEKYVTINPGEFVIFFPQDGHAPCISDEAEIVKVIFKIKA